MQLGNEIIACALRTGELRPFTEAGINREWLSSTEDISHAAVFPDEDRAAFETILRYWDQHAKVPTVDVFERSHPEATYRLPDSAYTPAELIAVWREDRKTYLGQVAAGDIADLVSEGNVDDAADLMDRAARTIREASGNRSIVLDWDNASYDVYARANRKVKRGVGTGIPAIDEQIPGFYQGNLIVYLGRAKAGKTSFLLLAALEAWMSGKKILFISVEIAAGADPNTPGIGDRLDAFGSGISYLDYAMGQLDPRAKDRLEAFRETCTDDVFKIVQPNGTYTATDLESDIDRYQPDVVFVDGFYFLTDRDTGKTGANWEGHDNLAGQLKKIGMDRSVLVFVSHQVREKQLAGKKGKGIDDGAMMSGTGLIMYADMLLGIDVDDEHEHMITCSRSRTGYFESVKGTWDWSTSTFTGAIETFAADVDESEYAY